METVSLLLEKAAEPMSMQEIKDRVTSKRRQTVVQAVDALVERGYVERTTGPRNQKLHRSIQPYREPKPGTV